MRSAVDQAQHRRLDEGSRLTDPQRGARTIDIDRAQSARGGPVDDLASPRCPSWMHAAALREPDPCRRRGESLNVDVERSRLR